MTIQEWFKKYRPHGFYAFIIVLFISIVSIWVGFIVFRPMPPKTVIMVTGPEGGTYRQTGEQYREIFARSGIDLQLQPTAGSSANLTYLNNIGSGVTIGLMQSGISDEQKSPDLETLGTVFLEPVWVFCRAEHRVKNFKDLRGKRISIGPEGSGTRALAWELLSRNGVTDNFAHFLPLSFEETSADLLSGKIDAAIMLTSWNSPITRAILKDKAIELLSFQRAEAYVALYPYLEKLVIPTGLVNLEENRPKKDISLIATRASLVVRKELHPAIKYLLLDAAVQVNSKSGIFHKAGQFPAPETIDFPLSKEARQFYKTGRPFLQRYLPFGLAIQVHRLLIIFIPLIGITYPLIKFFTIIFDWRMRRRVYMFYGELQFIEHSLDEADVNQDKSKLMAQLDRLEDKVDKIRLPKAYVGRSYRLREHIALVRDRLYKENTEDNNLVCDCETKIGE